MLLNKYVNKAILASANFPKLNEKCIKILKYLNKIEGVNDKNRTTTAI